MDEKLKPLSLRISENYERLSPADRRIADLILNFPGEIASYSARELAELAKTSNAALSRFVQRIGFANFQEMKHHARDMRNRGAPQYRIDSAQVQTLARQIDRHVQDGIDNIQETFGTIDRDMLSEAIEAIASARKVVFIGMRNGHFLAKYLRWQVSEMRDGTVLLPAAGETVGETLAGLDEADVLVVFAIRRLVPMVRNILEKAERRGPRLLVIADQSFTQPVRASWLLRCATRTAAPLDNHVSVLLLCHIIADELIQVLGTSGRKRLARIEDLHVLYDEM